MIPVRACVELIPSPFVTQCKLEEFLPGSWETKAAREFSQFSCHLPIMLAVSLRSAFVRSFHG
jgi:hypothetical protein